MTLRQVKISTRMGEGLGKASTRLGQSCSASMQILHLLVYFQFHEQQVYNDAA